VWDHICLPAIARSIHVGLPFLSISNFLRVLAISRICGLFGLRLRCQHLIRDKSPTDGSLLVSTAVPLHLPTKRFRLREMCCHRFRIDPSSNGISRSCCFRACRRKSLWWLPRSLKRVSCHPMCLLSLTDRAAAATRGVRFKKIDTLSMWVCQ
jgi:hypothetical protein